MLAFVSVLTCVPVAAPKMILPVMAPVAADSSITVLPPPTVIAVTPTPRLIVPVESTVLPAPLAVIAPVCVAPLATLTFTPGVVVEKAVAEDPVHVTVTPVESATQSASAALGVTMTMVAPSEVESSKARRLNLPVMNHP